VPASCSATKPSLPRPTDPLHAGLHARDGCPARGVVGLVIAVGFSFATIPVVALGDAKPDEAGSASASFSSIQQLSSAIGSAAVTSIFFQAATAGLAHAMKVSLVVVLAVTALSLPVVALMPRKAPSEPQQ